MVTELGAVSIDVLRDAVLAAPEPWWYEDTTRQGGTQVAKASQSIRLTDPASLAWQRFSAVVEPVLQEVITQWYPSAGRFGKIVFSRLLPMTRIAPHVDREPDQATLHRIHLPLVTNDAALLVFLEPTARPFHLVPGRAYEIASELPHLAFNKGPTSRIHCVFDYHF